MLVDSHCHLDLISPDPAEIANLVENAKAGGVREMLCVSVDWDNAPVVRQLAERFAGVYATAGLHPNSVREAECTAETLLELASHAQVVAVGETGLDYYRNDNQQAQQDAFRTHIRVALQLQKPLVIHMREATDDTIRLLREEGADRVGGVMHCFVEDWKTARMAMEMGFFISFSGIVTFRNATRLQEVARLTPLHYMLVETDSPWLAPTPYRGKINQPLWVRQVAEFIAALRGEPLAKVAEVTSDNFRRLFRIENTVRQTALP